MQPAAAALISQRKGLLQRIEASGSADTGVAHPAGLASGLVPADAHPGAWRYAKRFSDPASEAS